MYVATHRHGVAIYRHGVAIHRHGVAYSYVIYQAEQCSYIILHALKITMVIQKP